MIRFLLIFILIIGNFRNLYSGSETTNLQGLGMARTFTAVSRGLNTLSINPANLNYPDRSSFSFNLLNFSITAGSDLIDINLYNKYFTGDENGNPVFLNDADKRKILDIFPSGLAQTGFNFDLRLFSFSIQFEKVGSFAFNVFEKTGFNFLMPEDYLKFVLYGNPLGSKYDFSETYYNAIWCREYSLTYAREIPEPNFLKSLSAGLSAKLVHGYGFAEISHNRTHIETDNEARISGKVDYQVKFSGVDLFDENKDAKYAPFPEPAGSGLGFDIGLSGFINDELSFGFALIDLGTITWRQNTYEHSGYAVFGFDDPKTGQDQLDSLDRVMKGTNKPIKSFSSALPTVLRLGVAYQFDKAPFIENFPGELLLAFDYNQGFNNMVGNTTIPRFSLGVEYKPFKWLPLRTGISVGGNSGFNWAFGTGLLFSFMDLELATENFEAAIFPSSFDRISVALGIKIRI